MVQQYGVSLSEAIAVPRCIAIRVAMEVHVVNVITRTRTHTHTHTQLTVSGSIMLLCLMWLTVLARTPTYHQLQQQNNEAAVFTSSGSCMAGSPACDSTPPTTTFATRNTRHGIVHRGVTRGYLQGSLRAPPARSGAYLRGRSCCYQDCSEDNHSEAIGVLPRKSE